MALAKESPVTWLLALEAPSTVLAVRGTVGRRHTVETPSHKVRRHRSATTAQQLDPLLSRPVALHPLLPTLQFHDRRRLERGFSSL